MACPENSFHRVIVVGAGPAGLSCALHLKKLGVDDVLVVERASFPRDKCCAGYVTGKTIEAYRALGLDPAADCGYSLIDDFRLIHKGRFRLKIENRFLYTNRRIDRVELDDAFFRTAKARGVAIREDAAVTAHDPAARTVTLKDGTVLRYEAIVFADGAAGFGSRYRTKKGRNIAMQLIVPTDRPDSIEIHFGVAPAGYGWVSTYRGVTNIGLTDVYREDADYRALFREYMDRCGIDADIELLRGTFTPIGVGRAVLPGGTYLAGDALGACDPMTLSGLRYGLASGERAAKAIAENDDRVLSRYAEGLRVRFALMRAMQILFYTRPVRFLVFDIGCRCFGGAIAYVFNHFFVNKK